MGTQRFTHEARVRLTKQQLDDLRRLMAESGVVRQGEYIRACIFGPERTAITTRQTAAFAEKTHRLVAEMYEAILGKTALAQNRTPAVPQEMTRDPARDHLTPDETMVATELGAWPWRRDTPTRIKMPPRE